MLFLFLIFSISSVFEFDKNEFEEFLFFNTSLEFLFTFIFELILCLSEDLIKGYFNVFSLFSIILLLRLFFTLSSISGSKFFFF